MTICLTGVGPHARSAWWQALEHDRDAVVTQTPAWMDCVCATGAYEDATRAYVAADGHHLVLPLARRRAGRGPMVAVSMPFGWGTGGLLSSRGSISSRDVAGVVQDVARQRALFIGIRPCPATAWAWAGTVPTAVERTQHMTQSVPLSDDFEAVWSRAVATVRSHCRKAERRGVRVERDDTGRLIGVFDMLYRKSVERWAQQQHEPLWLARWRARRRDPPDKFRGVAQRLGPACRVWIAWRDGVALAALVVLTHGRHSTMWRSALDKEAARGTGAIELLHRAAIAEACSEGCRFYHLGDSAPASELARHKRGFGAIDVPYVGYRFERIPLTAADRLLRTQVKKAVGFRD